MSNLMPIGPSSGPSGHSKQELDAMARERGWQKPESLKAYYAMEPLAAEWYEKCHAAEFDRLCEKPTTATPKVFERRAGETDSAVVARVMPEVIKKFLRDFPQFLQSRDNQLAIQKRWELLDHEIVDDPYAALVGVYRDCVMAGEVEVHPDAIGLPGPNLEGFALKRAIREKPDFEKLLDSYVAPKPEDAERTRIERMSAAEFEAQDKALQWQRAQEERAAKIQAFEREVQSFLRTTPDYIASEENRDLILEWLKNNGLPMSQETIRRSFVALTASGKMQRDESRKASWNGSTLQIGDEDSNRRRPPESVLTGSLKRRVRGMSSEEYEAFIQAHPEAAKKIDEAA